MCEFEAVRDIGEAVDRVMACYGVTPRERQFRGLRPGPALKHGRIRRAAILAWQGGSNFFARATEAACASVRNVRTAFRHFMETASRPFERAETGSRACIARIAALCQTLRSVSIKPALVGLRAIADARKRLTRSAGKGRPGSTGNGGPERSPLRGIMPARATETPFHHVRLPATVAAAVVGVFVLGFGAWAAYAPLESAAIATGLVETESSRKTVQHLEGGIIRRILVRDGDKVSAGQVLVALDDTRARAAVQMLQKQLWDAEALEARLLAERDGESTVHFSPELISAARQQPDAADIMTGQRKIFETRRSLQASRVEIVRRRRAQAQQEITGLQYEAKAATTRAMIIANEVAVVTPLVAKKVQTRARLLQLQREQAEIEGRIGETMSEIARVEQSVGELETTIIKLEIDHQTEIAQSLRETKAEILQLVERFQAASDVLFRTLVRAPVAGTITDLRIHTAQGVVGAGEPLMDLVPSHDRLIVLAHVKPEDIDLVRPGLPAYVRLLSYNHRRVPPVEGVLSYVSADRLVDIQTMRSFYTARILLDKASLGALPEVEIMPGMPVEVLIRTGRSTVAHYALRPLLAGFERAFRED